MEDCVFCKIIRNELPSEKVYEDDKVLAFKDANPEAPVHVIIVPKKHIPSLNEITLEDELILGHIFTVAKLVAEKLGVSENGYRVVSNCGKDGGQTVPHVHYHLLAGRVLGWPPC